MSSGVKDLNVTMLKNNNLGIRNEDIKRVVKSKCRTNYVLLLAIES